MAKSTKRRWAPEEDKVLVEIIKSNPHNLTECFKIASTKLDRSITAINYRWYAVLGNPTNKNYIGTAFLAIGRESVYTNRKNYHTFTTYTHIVEPKKSKRSIWKKVLNIIFGK